MQNVVKILLTVSFTLLLSANPAFAALEQSKVTPNTTLQIQQDMQKLQTLWKSYQTNVSSMNKALPTIKQEKDINKKNASISVYNQKLEQTKSALNQLILPHSTANKLRQQIIEHATKYQGVYKLAAIDTLNNNQLNAFNRLNDQTSTLYQQMLNTAQDITH